MELYQAYTDYKGMMDITEEMFRTVAQNMLGTTKIPMAAMIWIWVSLRKNHNDRCRKAVYRCGF